MNQIKQPPLRHLSENLSEIIGGVSGVDTELKSVQGLLKDLKKTLGYPAKIEKDLKKIQTPLTTVQAIADDMSILPEIGAASGAVATTLKPLVKPKPPGGTIGETRAVLHEIDLALSGLKSGVDKVKKPIDDARSELGEVLTKLNQFKTGVDYLISIHGDSPPAGIKNCATELNRIIDKSRDDLRKAQDFVADKLSVFHDVAATIDGVLRGIGDFISVIDGLVRELTSGPFKTLQNALAKVEKHLDALKRAGKALIRLAFKAIGLDLDELEKGLKRFEARIENFIMDAIQQQLDRAKEALLDELNKMAPVQEIARMLSEFERKMAAIRDQVENGLGEECTRKLTDLG